MSEDLGGSGSLPELGVEESDKVVNNQCPTENNLTFLHTLFFFNLNN